MIYADQEAISRRHWRGFPMAAAIIAFRHNNTTLTGALYGLLGDGATRLLMLRYRTERPPIYFHLRFLC